MSLVIWDPDYMYEVVLAQKLNFELFDNAEIISGPITYDIKSDTRKKVVIKNWWFWAGTKEPAEDLSWADLVICYAGELVNGSWEWYRQNTISQFNNQNFVSVSNGVYNLKDFPSHVLYDDLGHFLSRIADVCKFEEWNVLEDKLKLFDALLGIAKSHRIFIFDQLVKHNLLDHSFVNIHGSLNYKSPDLDQFDDPVITDTDRQQSMSHVKGLKNGVSVSHSIPLKIYQNSLIEMGFKCSL